MNNVNIFEEGILSLTAFYNLSYCRFYCLEIYSDKCY